MAAKKSKRANIARRVKRASDAKKAGNAGNASFANSVITVRKLRPKLEDGILIIGLPGIGLVSKMAVDHLARSSKARRFATLYSPHFPNQVLALKNGRLRPFTMRFYEKKIGAHGVVFLKGDLQPLTVEGQYEVAAKILSFAKSLGVTKVIAMAGYAVQKTGALSGSSAKPAVYCSATDIRLFEELKKAGAKPAAGVVPIVGMAGLVPALARIYGLRGSCLLVETPGTTIDPHGAKALVEFLGKWMGKKFDSHDLEKRAKRAEKMLHKLEEQSQPSAQAPKAGAPAVPEPIKRETLNYIR